MEQFSYYAFLEHLNKMINAGEYTGALSDIDAALAAFPEHSIDILAQAYDIAQKMPDKSRYAQYQSRFFDFGIKPDDRVLDMGSGHIPFPLATHLADISLTDPQVGRAGIPFVHVSGKPAYECSVEKTPFADKEFDFVYCSHVLEHVTDPEAACRELMRIGKRGYIECPNRGKDTFYATAKQSHHLWAVESLNGVLVFTEYTEADIRGIDCSILLDMNCAPRTQREKAVAALDIVKTARLNTMLLWDGSFSYEVRRLQPWSSSVQGPKEVSLTPVPSLESGDIPFSKKICSRLRRMSDKIRSKLASIIEP